MALPSDSRKLGFLGKFRQFFLPAARPHLKLPVRIESALRSEIRCDAQRGYPNEEMWLLIKLRGNPVDYRYVDILNDEAVLSHDQRMYLCRLINHLVNSGDRPDPADYYPIFAKYGGDRVVHDDLDDVLSFFIGENIPRKLRNLVWPFKMKPVDLDESAIRSKIHRCFVKGFYFDAMEGMFQIRGTPLDNSQIKVLNNRTVLSYDQLKYLAHLADYLVNSGECPDPAQYRPIFAPYGGDRVVHDNFDHVLSYFLSGRMPKNLCKIVPAFKIESVNLDDTNIRSKIHHCAEKGFYFDGLERWFELCGTPLNKSQIRILNDQAVLSYDQLRYVALLADHLANSAEHPNAYDPPLFRLMGGYRVLRDDFKTVLGFFLGLNMLDMKYVKKSKIKHHFSKLVTDFDVYRDGPLDGPGIRDLCIHY